MVVDFKKVLKENEKLKNKGKKRRTKRTKVLKKPREKLPSYSSDKLFKQIAKESSMGVKEGRDYSNPPQDNRSLFFKKDQVKSGGWI